MNRWGNIMVDMLHSNDFLKDVKRRLKQSCLSLPISEIDIDNTVRTTGSMSLPFLKQLAEEDTIPCQQCGVCCQKVTPISITKKEIKIIAKYLNTSPSKLMRKYNITYSSKRDQWSLPGVPCPFLKGKNTCTIYPVRMYVCREFPFKRMYEEGVAGRQVGIHPLCPIVREAMARFYTSGLIAKKFSRAGDAGVMV